MFSDYFNLHQHISSSDLRGQCTNATFFLHFFLFIERFLFPSLRSSDLPHHRNAIVRKMHFILFFCLFHYTQHTLAARCVAWDRRAGRKSIRIFPYNSNHFGPVPDRYRLPDRSTGRNGRIERIETAELMLLECWLYIFQFPQQSKPQPSPSGSSINGEA